MPSANLNLSSAAFAQPIAQAMWHITPDGAAAVVNFHIAFNLTLAIVFIGLLDAAARLTRVGKALDRLQEALKACLSPLWAEAGRAMSSLSPMSGLRR